MELTDRQPVRFGIIGCSMGLSHGLGIQRVMGAELAAVCDPDEQILARAQKVMNLHESDCYPDYQTMLGRNDIDGVIVASPDQFHCEQTVAALESGRHVLCEKPMALNADECSRMNQTARRMNRKLMVGQICRYAPGFMAAKAMIARGEIGSLFFVESEYAHDYSFHPGVGNWRKDPVRLRQPVLGGGCHAVDLLRWVAGNPIQVNAYANRKVLTGWPVDDCTVGILTFPDGVIGKVFVSIGCKRSYTMRSVFYGTQGTIIADNTSSDITLFKDSILGKGDYLQGARDQTLGIAYPVENNSHNTAGEIMEFVDAITQDKPIATSGVEGASTVAVCLALVESAAQNGMPVKVCYDF